MTMSHRITKAVVPAAGLGTRFLPATKSTPKEMLPVVDRPAVQYIVEEAVESGLTDVLMVTGRNKRTLEDHFDRAPELEEALAAKGDRGRLAGVRAATEPAALFYVRQGAPLGLGHAVLRARPHIGGQPFAVLLPDDLIDPGDRLLQRMLRVRRERGGSVVALMEVEPEQIGMYGCAATEPAGEDGVLRVSDLVEKPGPGEAPGNLAVIGRYVLDPAVFDVLEALPPGRGGEVQLTDALRVLASDPAAGGPVHGVLFGGGRYDTGDRAEYLRAVVRLAARHGELGPGFRDWLHGFVAELGGPAGRPAPVPGPAAEPVPAGLGGKEGR